MRLYSKTSSDHEDNSKITTLYIDNLDSTSNYTVRHTVCGHNFKRQLRKEDREFPSREKKERKERHYGAIQEKTLRNE